MARPASAASTSSPDLSRITIPREVFWLCLVAPWLTAPLIQRDLVNLAHVRSLRCADGAGELTLDDGQRIPVSRRALPGLREQLRARTGR